MKTGIDMLSYACQRTMLRAWEKSGRLVFVRRKRNGSIEISFNGGKGKNVHAAMIYLENWLSTTADGKNAMREIMEVRI